MIKKTKLCGKCKVDLPIDNYRNRIRKNKYAPHYEALISECMECERIGHRERRRVAKLKKLELLNANP